MPGKHLRLMEFYFGSCDLVVSRLTLQRDVRLNLPMTTAAFISLSQAHPHLAAFAATPDGPMETVMRVSGYVFALIAAAVIVAAIEALNDR